VSSGIVLYAVIFLLLDKAGMLCLKEVDRFVFVLEIEEGEEYNIYIVFVNARTRQKLSRKNDYPLKASQ